MRPFLFCRTGLVPAIVTMLIAGVSAFAEMPYLSFSGDCPQLIVDGKPMLVIGGELHNSSASTVEQIESMLGRVSSMRLNTVLAPIAWEQFEPREGVFDFSLIDALIEQAEAHDLRLIVLWFATWKNGQSSYAPMWVKSDTARFRRVQTRDGELIETLSPFCEATRDADATAFAALMRRIKERDRHNTVVMVQPENEAGIFLDMDYSPAGNAALESPVPDSLIAYLQQLNGNRSSAVEAAWDSQGRPAKGSWTDLFGDGPEAQEFLLAWQIASFINDVAAAGQREHPLPMFANAWIMQRPDEPAGEYPNGGPVARVIDIYKAAAPNLFALAPDIYLPNFKEVCDHYVRDDNPLVIPESTVDAARAFYAFAEHDAICYSPFGFEERVSGDQAFQAAYAVLGELHDEIVEHQGGGRMHGFLREGDELSRTVQMGQYRVNCFYENQSEPCYGLIIQESEQEFLVAGVNLRMEFRAINESVVGYIGTVLEVLHDGDAWRTVRVLNGDETFHHGSLRVMGRESRDGVTPLTTRLGPQPEAGESEIPPPHPTKRLKTPGIYRVQTYLRPRYNESFRD